MWMDLQTVILKAASSAIFQPVWHKERPEQKIASAATAPGHAWADSPALWRHQGKHERLFRAIWRRLPSLSAEIWNCINILGGGLDPKIFKQCFYLEWGMALPHTEIKHLGNWALVPVLRHLDTWVVTRV